MSEPQSNHGDPLLIVQTDPRSGGSRHLPRSLHVVVGPTRLLRPRRVLAMDLAALIKSGASPLALDWIEPKFGRHDHEVLLCDAEALPEEMESRQRIAARAMGEDVAPPMAPLLVFPGLMEAPDAVPAVARLAQESGLPSLTLWSLAFTLGGTPGAVLETLAERLRQADVVQVNCATLVPDPTKDSALYAAVKFNAAAARVTDRLAERLEARGLPNRQAALLKTVGARLTEWETAGLELQDLSAEAVEELAHRLAAVLFGYTA